MRVDHVRTDGQFRNFGISCVQTNRPVKRCAPTAISVLFMSWLVVVGAGSGGEEVEGERGASFFCAFITALWIGLEGWLFGGFIFNGPPSMRRSPTVFFVCVYVVVYPELYVWRWLHYFVFVAGHSFCVYHHSRRHQPTSRFQRKIQKRLLSSNASWCRCTILARSGCLMAFSTNMRNSLCTR